MSWETIASGIGTALGGPLGGLLGSTVGGLFGNKTQSQAIDTAAAARTAGLNNAFASLNGAYGNAQGAQANQFGTAVGLQNGYLDRGIGLAGSQNNAALASLNGLLSPYAQGGQSAIGGLNQYGQAGEAGLGGMNQYGQDGLSAFNRQAAISGAMGPEAQAAAISSIEGNPLYQAMNKQAEDALLQNASATGSLRGGNTMSALATLRPQMLNNAIQQEYGNLGSLSALGSQNYGNLASLGGQSYGNLGSLGGQAAGTNAQGVTQLTGNSMSYLGNLLNSTAGNVSSASNAYAGNLANMAPQFAGSLASLMNAQGSVGADAAIGQGAASSGSDTILGKLLGGLLQQGGQYATGTGSYASLR